MPDKRIVSQVDRVMLLCPGVEWLFGLPKGATLDQVADPGPRPDAIVDRAFDVELVRQYVAKLPERERTVVQLRYGIAARPMTCRQVAAFCGIAPASVHAAEHRALERLRQWYARDGLGPPTHKTGREPL
jgi:RNA polymerase sigma factor (sigma-70 family)